MASGTNNDPHGMTVTKMVLPRCLDCASFTCHTSHSMSIESSTTMAATQHSPAGWQIQVTTFDSFDDAFLQISSASHLVRGNLYTFRRNTKRMHLLCKEGSCSFEAYISYDKKKASYILRRYQAEHTCVGVQEQKRGSLHSSSFIESKVSDIPCSRQSPLAKPLQVRDGMAVTRQTTTQQVMVWYRDNHGPIHYHTALRVLHAIRGDEYDEQSHQFALLPSYAAQVLVVDPLATAKLKLIGSRFPAYSSPPLLPPRLGLTSGPSLQLMLLGQRSYTIMSF
jgi:hypothetical protein